MKTLLADKMLEEFL